VKAKASQANFNQKEKNKKTCPSQKKILPKLVFHFLK
jgi:hypothetical protein